VKNTVKSRYSAILTGSYKRDILFKKLQFEKKSKIWGAGEGSNLEKKKKFEKSGEHFSVSGLPWTRTRDFQIRR